jgi:hypothetical protein
LAKRLGTAWADAEELCRAAGLNWWVHKRPAPGARLIDEKKKVYDRYLVVRDPVQGPKSLWAS